MNLKIQKFVAISFVFLAICTGASSTAAQSTDGKAPLLIGAWESVAPVSNNCETGEPEGPIVRVSYLFNQGGTMILEDTFPLEGPYRSTGPGIWRRETNGEYSYSHMHYSFIKNDDGTFDSPFRIKVRSRLTLSQDGNSFTENGAFEGIDNDDNVLFGGCFSGTAKRIVF